MKNLTTILLMLLMTSSLFAQQQVVEKIVARIGGEIMLLSEIEEMYAYQKSQGAELPDDARCLIIDNILGQKLLLNQARLDSIVVSDLEVVGQVEARINQITAMMGGSIRDVEQYYGKGINEIRKETSDFMKEQLLVQRMQQQVLGNVSITPREVKEFFHAIPTDSLPYFNAEVEIAEIVIYPEASSEERQATIDEINAIRQQIIDGGNFEELAKKHSIDRGSAAKGGDLGWQQRGQFVQEFEAVAYNLEPGEISEPVESQFGFHLIELLERRGNAIHARHILISPEIDYDDFEKTEAEMDSIRDLIVVDTMDFTYAVKRFSNEDEQSFNYGGNILNPKTGDNFFDTGELEPDIYFAIEDLEPGNVTDPIKFTNRRDKTGYRLIQLRSRTQPHIASLKTDYSKIKQAALQAKKDKALSKWVNDKINTTFIEVAPEYKDCTALSKWISGL